MKKAIDLASEALYGAMRGMALPTKPDDLPQMLDHHIGGIASWAERIQPFPDLMGGPESTDLTVPLRIDMPRRFRVADTRLVNEDGLLAFEGGLLLQGPPGSGKTTTVKRLVRRVLTESEGPAAKWRYPLVVRMREHEGAASIERVVAELIGLRYDAIETHGEKQLRIKDIAGEAYEGPRTTNYEIGSVPLQTVIASLLAETGALLLVDALDEARTDHDRRFRRSLEGLVNAMPKGLVIVTTRPGHLPGIQGFQPREIQPLNEPERREIVTGWLDTPDSFLNELQTRGYQGLASRPLILTWMMLEFRIAKRLPLRAVDLYNEITNVLVKGWDRLRLLDPRQAGAGYLRPPETRRFLAALAHHLTFSLEANSFTAVQLAPFYRKVHEGFGLPGDDLDEVLEEIECNTGLIVRSGPRDFEFEHLILQEFLAAEHVSTTWGRVDQRRFLRISPETLAVATGLIPDAGDFVSTILVPDLHGSASEERIARFVRRLTAEGCGFSDSASLGMTVVMMLGHRSLSVVKSAERILELPGAGSCFAAGLDFYGRDNRYSTEDLYVLLRRLQAPRDLGVDFAHRLEIKTAVLDPLLTRFRVTLRPY